MNYITHMNNLSNRIYNDERMNTAHIALYLALFQSWNANRFNNPILVTRLEVMKASKIKSVKTLLKCLKELDDWKYIDYQPSHNPYLGSRINMIYFDTATNKPKPVNKSNLSTTKNKNYNEPL
jgi:hypothetical protein